MNAVAFRNVKFISHSDQGGRGDGVQIMVHRGYAYIGHGYSNGISVIDVRDPKNPRPVAFVPCPPNTRAIHLQTHDDLLLAVNGPSMWTMQIDAQAYYSGSPADLLKGRQYTAGVRVYDIAHPDAPREIAFMATEGVGPHRIWYVGGRYAYVSIHYPEFTDQVLAIVDMAEPTRPEVVGKWWIPGMWTGGGETPSWPKGPRYALHHALVAGNFAYGAWRDGGLTVLDVGDPTRPNLLAHRNLDPPFGAARTRRCRSPIATCWCWRSGRDYRRFPRGDTGLLVGSATAGSLVRDARANQKIPTNAWNAILSPAKASAFQATEARRLRDHYGNGRLSPGPVSETNRPHRALPCVNMFGVVVIGIQIRGLSSCSGGTSPKAPGRSNDASVERAPRRRDRPARTNSGRDRENVGAPPRRNCRPRKRNPRPIIRGLHQIPFRGDRVLRSRAGRLI
jgi:LVIVD repeat